MISVISRLLRLLTMAGMLAMCAGCMQWEATRAVHSWGERTHLFDPHGVRTTSPGPEPWENWDIPLYQFKAHTYIERKHSLSSKTADQTATDDLRYFYRTTETDFTLILAATNHFMDSRLHLTSQGGVGDVFWDYVAFDEAGASEIRAADGHLLRTATQSIPTEDPSSHRYVNWRIAYRQIRNEQDPWTVLAEVFPYVDRSGPLGRLVDYNSLYILANRRDGDRFQPWYLHVLKAPVYVLSVPFDIITAPLQALASLRIGP